MHIGLKDQKEALMLLEKAIQKESVIHRFRVAKLNDLSKSHVTTSVHKNQFILTKNLCDIEVYSSTFLVHLMQNNPS